MLGQVGRAQASRKVYRCGPRGQGGRMSKFTTAAVMLLGIVMMALSGAPAMAAPPPGGVTCQNALATQALRSGGGTATGQQPDLVISSLCTVNKAGDYVYGQVNIIAGGSLVFVEPNAPGSQVNFWASSIIVENGGAL